MKEKGRDKTKENTGKKKQEMKKKDEKISGREKENISH